MKRLSSGEDANPQSITTLSDAFGVTPGYLRKCRVIQIKIAQGQNPAWGVFPDARWCPSSPRCAMSTSGRSCNPL